MPDGREKNNRARLSQQCPGTGPRDSGQKLKCRKFQSNAKNPIFLLFKHWSRLPEEVMEPPSLEIFKSQLHTTMGNVL